MEKSKPSNHYSSKVRARTIRMVLEYQGSYETQASAIVAIAPKIGCIAETLRLWVRQAEQDSGSRDGVSSGERERIKELKREVRQLCQANEILRKASAYFAKAEHSGKSVQRLRLFQHSKLRGRPSGLPLFKTSLRLFVSLQCPTEHQLLMIFASFSNSTMNSLDPSEWTNCPTKNSILVLLELLDIIGA